MDEAIAIMVKWGMTKENATKSFNEQCSFLMRGRDAVSREYAEQMILGDVLEMDELPQG